MMLKSPHFIMQAVCMEKEWFRLAGLLGKRALAGSRAKWTDLLSLCGSSCCPVEANPPEVAWCCRSRSRTYLRRFLHIGQL